MLDSDLGRIYGTSTGALNRAAKRNRERFPSDFLFQISPAEWKNLKCQIGTSSSTHGGRRRGRPYAFIEHGAIMAANVLNSTRAVQMSVFVVRAFLKMRPLLGDKRGLAQKLASLEKELKKATRCSRGCHRHDFATSHGHHRSSSPPSSAAQAANWIQSVNLRPRSCCPWSVILWSSEPPLRPLTSHASRLDAFLLLIRPFKLDGVTKHLLKAPRANVTDFSIGIVIPTRPRDRIGDCLTQLMRTGCG